MRTKPGQQGASPEMMAEFDAWAQADEAKHGKRVVIFAEHTTEPVTKTDSFPADTEFELGGSVTPEQFRAWFLACQQCEGVCCSVAAVIQDRMDNGDALDIELGGLEHKLISVEWCKLTTCLAYSPLVWVAPNLRARVKGIRSFNKPDVLTGQQETSHVVLKLNLADPDGARTHIFCDPTVRQVNPKAPHNVKLYTRKAFAEHDKYGDFITQNHEDVYDTERWRWRAAWTSCFRPESMPEAVLEANIAEWKRVMQTHSKLRIDWEEVEDDVENKRHADVTAFKTAQLTAVLGGGKQNAEMACSSPTWAATCLCTREAGGGEGGVCARGYGGVESSLF